MLEHLLLSEIFAWLMVFFRLGGALMALPGIGEAYVSMRIRLLLALSLSLMLSPAIGPLLPPIPDSPSGVVLLILSETLSGLFFGIVARMLISTMHVTGTIIALQSGLASAMMLDHTQTTQSTVVTNLLSVTAMVLFFATDMHHAAIRAAVESYDIFPPGRFPSTSDSAYYVAQTMSRTFAVAVQLASPHLVIGLILYLGGGVLARLMPGIQIFFIMMSPQIMLSLFILMVTLSAMMMWYMQYLETSFLNFLR